MQTLKESAYIYLKYPNLYNEMMAQADATEKEYYKKTGKKMSVWHGDSKYNTEYRDYIVKTKWVPRVLAELEEVLNESGHI